MPGTRAGVKNEVRAALNAATINMPLSILIDWMAEMNRDMEQLTATVAELARIQREQIDTTWKISTELNERLCKVENA